MFDVPVNGASYLKMLKIVLPALRYQAMRFQHPLVSSRRRDLHMTPIAIEFLRSKLGVVCRTDHLTEQRAPFSFLFPGLDLCRFQILTFVFRCESETIVKLKVEGFIRSMDKASLRKMSRHAPPRRTVANLVLPKFYQNY